MPDTPDPQRPKPDPVPESRPDHVESAAQIVDEVLVAGVTAASPEARLKFLDLAAKMRRMLGRTAMPGDDQS